MANNYIDKFKKNGIEYEIHAESAEYANVAATAQVCETCNSIGNVKKYSTTPSGEDDKYREGLRIENIHGKDGLVQGIIELNNKGNLALESLDNHVNLEAKKQIKMKPTTKMIWDSSRKVEAGKGNEFEIEAVNDDLDTNDQEKWSELKIKSRNIDLRCNNHGGIALQIAGKDGDDNENKIKFESDRTSSISEAGTYNGEGGKGLEFGTFNNLHSSLYTGDYRFRGNGFVYGVLRDAPVTQGDKVDYITQDDDFKDPINNTTPKATWNQIIEAANKCVGKEEVASVQQVEGLIAEASIPGYTGTTGHLATQEYVQDYVAQHGGGAGSYQAGTGIHIEDNTISVNNYSNIEPLTALTNNTTALGCVKIGKTKGNLQLDVKGKYTYEANVDAVDEYGNEVAKGGRVVNYSDEEFYNDPNKYYYKALVNGLTYEDTTQNAQKGACAYKHEAFPSVDKGAYFYVAKKNAKIYPGGDDARTANKGDIVLQYGMTSEEISYYDCVTADTKWTKGYILSDSDNESFYDENWEKTPLWIHNEININLESDSKIKFDGAKIETTHSYPEVEGGDDVDHRMEEITLSAENLVIDSTNVNYEKKVTKNGDLTEEPMLSYSFENKLFGENGEIVVTKEQFIENYKSKHEGTTLTDDEIIELYDEYIEMGANETITVKVSDLLRLVGKVAALEARVAALEHRTN